MTPDQAKNASSALRKRCDRCQAPLTPDRPGCLCAHCHEQLVRRLFPECVLGESYEPIRKPLRRRNRRRRQPLSKRISACFSENTETVLLTAALIAVLFCLMCAALDALPPTSAELAAQEALR